MINCLICNRETNNPKFCSRSCAAKHNNTVAVKRTKTKQLCKVCNVEIPLRNRRIICDDCKSVKWLSKSLENAKAMYGKGHHAKIRQFARKEMRSSERSCFACGYNKFVEVCHIIPIREFQANATITQINNRNNLVFLCPNCHWELDHGFLNLDFVEFDSLHP